MSAEIVGLWRDGKRLVVDVRTHAFPDRCLKSNDAVSPTEWEDIELKTTGVPREELATVRAVLVASSRKLVEARDQGKGNRVKVPLRIPLSFGWQKKAQSPVSKWVVATGIGLFILSLVSRVLLRSFLPAEAAYAGLALGVGIFLAGLIMLTIRDAGPLSLRGIADGKIWLGGVCPQFLESLPNYAKSPELVRRMARRSRRAKWTLLIAGSSVTALAILLTGMSIWRANQIAAAATWPSTKGKITRSKVSKQERFAPRRGFYMHYGLDLKYTYQVQTSKHSGSRYSFSGHSFPDAAAAKNVLARYPVGQEVRVYYDPDRPERSSLNVGPGDADIRVTIVGPTVLYIIGIGSLAGALFQHLREHHLRKQLQP